MKGAMQGFVSVVDASMSKLMNDFVTNAAYFEQRAHHGSINIKIRV